MWINRLSAEQADLVRGLVARTAAADGTEPLNEEAGFALRDGSAEHLLHLAGDTLAGYLQLQPQHRIAQLVVDVHHRRCGIGSGLLAALEDRCSTDQQTRGDRAQDESREAGGSRWAAWAFGDLPPARAFAGSLHLAPSRSLLIMERALTGPTSPKVPDGLSLRGYTSADAADLLAVNAAAFASHPEQGALDAAGLAARMAEPWFDPDGLILAFDGVGLAGFHWTKRHDRRTGEVYVIGVAPRAQGRGYGRVLLEAGLAHLHQTATERVLLYVDSAERVAVRMYESAGFHIAHRDVLYAPQHQTPAPTSRRAPGSQP